MTDILFYKDDPDRFLSLIDPGRFSYLDPVSFCHLARYYVEYFGDGMVDLSFMMVANNRAEVIVPCQMVNGVLRHNGGPVVCHFALGQETRKGTQVVQEVCLDLIARYALQAADVRTPMPTGVLSPLGERFLKLGAQSTPLFWAVVDLTRSESEIHKGIRKSYASLIHWGRDHLRWAYLTKDNPDAAVYEAVRQFHIQVAGRVTRSKESWDVHLDMIREGRAEMSVGYLDGALVSAALFLDEGHKTTYGVGIFERSLFDKPLAHAMIYDGALRAKARGQSLYVLGDVYPKGSVEDKLYHIGDFKKGFTDQIQVELLWSLTAADQAVDAD